MLERLCRAQHDGIVLRASNKSLGLGGRFIASLGWCCRKLGDPYALDRDWLEAEGRRRRHGGPCQRAAYSEQSPFQALIEVDLLPRYLSKLLGGSSSR